MYVTISYTGVLPAVSDRMDKVLDFEAGFSIKNTDKIDKLIEKLWDVELESSLAGRELSLTGIASDRLQRLVKDAVCQKGHRIGFLISQPVLVLPVLTISMVSDLPSIPPVSCRKKDVRPTSVRP